MNTNDYTNATISLGGFPFAEASVGVWIATRNGDGFVPVPAVAYAGDVLCTAAARAVRRLIGSLMRYIESILPDPVILDETAPAGAAPETEMPMPVPAPESKAA